MSSLKIEDTFLYISTDIAKYIIALANERQITINMTKVQKLLYITYSVFLRVHERRLLNEHPQAWPYGPVFPTTRNYLDKKELTSISRADLSPDLLSKVEEDKALNKVIDFVLANFGTWNAGQLSEWSHSPGSPWDTATKSDGFKWGGVISDSSILEYFSLIISIKSEGE